MDLNELKQRYGVETKEEEKPKFGKRRPWLEAAPSQPAAPDCLGAIATTRREIAEKPEQVDGKAATNREQTENKPATKAATNREQTGNDLIAHPRPNKETGNKVGTEPATLSATNRQQTENKTATNRPFSSLVGLQRAIMVFLYEACKAARGRSTEFLALEHIGRRLKASPGSVKTTIQRLEKKNCLMRIDFKNGRGGYSKYELPEIVFRELLQLETENKLATNWQQTENKVGSELATEPATSSPCSSSNLNISNTTTTHPTKTVGETDPFWLIVPKRLDGLVSVKQLRDFVRQGFISEDVLQTSLDGFALDLEKGAVKAKNGNPVAILIGAIKGGGYISQQYLSELKASLAEVEKARAELHKLQAENVAEEIRKEFESFREKFPEQAEKMKPAAKFINTFQAGSVGYRMWVDEYKRQREGMQEAAQSELPNT